MPRVFVRARRPSSRVLAGKTMMLLLITVLSIWAHELGHALAASVVGDSLAARRLTIKPLVNLDPLLSFVLPLASSLLTGGLLCVGMGRPFLLSKPNAKILIAGPLMNLYIALMAGVLYVSGFEWALLVLRVNLVLAVFNALPIRPLDGWGVLVQWRYRVTMRKIANDRLRETEAREAEAFRRHADGLMREAEKSLLQSVPK